MLVYSSDLDEVLALAARIVVASRGALLEPPAGRVARRDRRADARGHLGRAVRAHGWLVGAAALARRPRGARARARSWPGTMRAAALGALWTGAFGSWYALTSATLVRAVPLIIIGLGIALAFRGRRLQHRRRGAVLRRRDRGDLGRAARRVAPVGHRGPGRAARRRGLAGVLWVALPVWLQLRFGVLEVISTLLLNFVAEALVSLMVQGPLQESQGIYPQSDTIAEPRPAAAAAGDAASRGILLALARRGRALRMCSAGRSGASGSAPSAPARAPRRSAVGSTRAGWPRSRCWRSGAIAGLAGGGRGRRGVLRALPESLARLRVHRDRRGAARAARPAGRGRDRHSLRGARGGRRRRCSATPACRRWRCTWWRRW